MTAESTIREQVCRFARSLFERGLTPGSSGNISVRHGDTMLISPSGVPYEQLEPEDIVAMTLTGEYGSYLASGANVPSSEWRFHLDIMRARQLSARGYRIWTQTIPTDVTPKNRLLLGEPRCGQRFG